MSLCRILAVIAVSIFATQAAEKRLIKADDIYLFHWVADPQVSPDGSQVAYTYVGVNTKHDGYDTSLWLVPATGGAPRQITAGPRDSSPRWSPDGKRLAFVRASEKDGKPEPGQIFVLPMNGGEARQLTSVAKGAGSPEWSPDGHTIAFNSTTSPKDPEKKDGEKKEDEKSDVRVINRAVYRFNGGGYNDTTHPAHIWTVSVPDFISTPQKATQVTFP